jgi:cytochrome c oxidase assembly protein subunit 15
MAACPARSLFRNALKLNSRSPSVPLRKFTCNASRLAEATRSLPCLPGRGGSFWTRTQKPFGTFKSFSKPSPGYFSSNALPSSVTLPPLSPPSVGYWLLFSSALVFGIVVVGGVTRLTESGLSITEWKPITGILPPLSSSDWEDEFSKYKLTPEFKLYVHLV